jgi:hypothetical protein
MAITYTGGVVQVAGSKDSGTCSGLIDEYTLNCASKSWTTNAWAGYVVYITGGTGAGQSRVVQLNDGQNLYPRSPFAIPPDNTSTFVLSYRLADAVAAVGTYVTLTANTTLYACSVPITIISGGYFNTYKENLRFSTDGNFLTVATGGFFQAGELVPSGNRGFGGGEIIYQASSTWAGSRQSTQLWDCFNGKIRLYGAALTLQNPRSELTNIMEVWLTGSATSPYPDMQMVDVTLNELVYTAKSGAVINRALCHAAPKSGTVSGNPYCNSRIVVYSGAQVKASTSIVHLKTGNWIDVIDPTTDNVAGADIVWDGNGYPALWGLTTSSGDASYSLQVSAATGNLYFGSLVKPSISDSSGSPLVATIGLMNSAGNPGIMTSVANNAPVFSYAVQTNVSGTYVGCVGSGEGLPVLSFAYVSNAGISGGAFTLRVRAYGYVFQSFAKTYNWLYRYAENIALPANANTAVTSTVASAYTGISISGTTNTITMTGTRSLQELYDYGQWWACQTANIKYAEPLVAGGNGNFTSSYNLTINGGTLTGTGTLNLGSNSLTLTGGGTVSPSTPVTYSAGTWTALTFSVVDSSGVSVTGYEYRLYVKSSTTGVIGASEITGYETQATNPVSVFYTFNTSAVIAELQVIKAGYLESVTEFTLGSTPIAQTITLQLETNI